MKPKVYIETSMLSYLAARLSNDLRVAANQSTTIEWWETRRPHFDLFFPNWLPRKRVLAILSLPRDVWMQLNLYQSLL